MKVIITGATGMVGKGVLLECFDNPDVESVLSIGRRQTDIRNAKLIELVHEDFSNFSSVKNKLDGFDAVYLCMGVSSAGMSEEQYTKLTYDYTLSLASILYDRNPEMTLTYVSGQGTDSSEKGKSMWARVKGKTENDLLKLGFRQSFMFRPGGIIPTRGTKPSSKIYHVLITYLGWFLKLLKVLAPNSIVNSDQIGQAMINLTKNGYQSQIINPKDIIALSEEE